MTSYCKMTHQLRRVTQCFCAKTNTFIGYRIKGQQKDKCNYVMSERYTVQNGLFDNSGHPTFLVRSRQISYPYHVF